MTEIGNLIDPLPVAGRRKVVLLATVEDREIYVPLSILTLASILHDRGFDTELIDVQVDRDWEPMLEAALPESLLLGVTCLTSPSIRHVLKARQIARRTSNEVPIVWGGYHATLAYQAILREGLADYVVRGQGEYALLGLCRALTQSASRTQLWSRLSGVRNLAYRQEDSLRVNPLERIADMNALPRLNYDLLNVQKYIQGDRLELSYISSYGCPYACTFCSEPTFSGRRWQPLKPTRVVEELIDLNERFEPSIVNMMDPNFSTHPKRVVEIVRLFLEREKSVSVLCDMRARDIVRIARDLDLADMRRAGIRKIYIGAESGSDRMLKRLRKSQQADDTLQACRLLDAEGIYSYTSFIHDLPGETEEDSRRTLELAEQLCALKHNRQFHHFFTPFPSTEIYDSIVEDSESEWTGRSQSDWARSSTFHGNDFWQGRFKFRKSVLRALLRLRDDYPGTFQPPSTLPLLKRLMA
ncbi:MAG TPA: radical SAM protein [Acidobacteriota bacterium]|nr:radical SAM protein [Acidobacteriota bacterium]